MGRVVNTHSMVVVGTAAAALVICLVVFVKEKWYFGLFLIGVAFFEMFQIFLVGTIYEVACHQFVRKLYDVQWNRLSPASRSVLLIILRMAQLPNLSTLAGIAPTNLNTFLQVFHSNSECKGIPITKLFASSAGLKANIHPFDAPSPICGLTLLSKMHSPDKNSRDLRLKKSHRVGGCASQRNIPA